MQYCVRRAGVEEEEALADGLCCPRGLAVCAPLAVNVRTSSPPAVHINFRNVIVSFPFPMAAVGAVYDRPRSLIGTSWAVIDRPYSPSNFFIKAIELGFALAGCVARNTPSAQVSGVRPSLSLT